MRVLIACEKSGVVRSAFRKLGHEAWSCDIEPAEDGSEYHIQGDAIEAAYSQHWDLMIAHPECTFLANSGAKNLYLGEGNHRRKENGIYPDRWAQMGYAASFFNMLRRAPPKRKAVENPVMLGHPRRLFGIPKPTQIIQPWQFGHGETKATCLWLENLPPLVPTDVVPGRTQACFLMTPSEDRKAKRSRTYDGIGQAMAEQWGNCAAIAESF